MTAPDPDPLTIAREVIRQHGYLDRAALSRREKERLDLARAVIDMTARLDAERFAHANTAVRVKNVEALADRLDGETERVSAPGVGFTTRAFAAIRAAIAAEIRGALKG